MTNLEPNWNGSERMGPSGFARFGSAAASPRPGRADGSGSAPGGGDAAGSGGVGDASTASSAKSGSDDGVSAGCSGARLSGAAGRSAMAA